MPKALTTKCMINPNPISICSVCWGLDNYVVISGKKCFPYLTQQQQQQQVPFRDNGNHVHRRHVRHRAKSHPSLLFVALDSRVQCDSRIYRDPAALERLIYGMGGMIGPAMLEGESNPRFWRMSPYTGTVQLIHALAAFYRVHFAPSRSLFIFGIEPGFPCTFFTKSRL